MVHGPGSMGMQVNRFLDALGYPDKFGDAIGAFTDMKTGNVAGAFRNLVDLNSGMTTGQMDRMFGKGTVPGFGKGTFPRMTFSGPHLYAHRHTYVSHEQVGKRAQVGQKFGYNWGPFKLQGRISGRQYVGSFAKPVKLQNDQYLFRGRTYESLGSIWKDARDGRVDGRATTVKSQISFGIKPGFMSIGNMLGRVNANWNPSQMLNSIFNQPGGLFGGIPSQIPGLPGGGSGGGGGAPGTGGVGGGGGAGGPSVLSNPNLTMEDKLALLMAKLSEHLDKQIEEKMGEIEKAMQQEKGGKSGKSGGAGGAGGGGLLGGLGGSLGQLGSLAGMGVGMMYGGPLGGSIGSALGGKAGNLLGGILGGGGGGGAGGAGGTSGAGGAGGDGKKPNLQLLQTQLQQILQKRQQMFQTMSSILKSLHDTSMNAIRNLKA